MTDLYGFQDYGDGQDLSLEQFFGYDAPPVPRSRLADAMQILFRQEEEGRRRQAEQLLRYEELGRRAQAADLADQGDEGDILPFEMYQQNVGWNTLTPQQQQAEYDYYVDKIAGGRLASTDDRKRFRQEFAKRTPRPEQQRELSDYFTDPLIDLAGRGPVALGEAVTGLSDATNPLVWARDAAFELDKRFGGPRQPGEQRWVDSLPDISARGTLSAADRQLRALLGLEGTYTRDGGAAGDLGRMQSGARQEARQNVQDAQGFTDTLKAYAQNPSELAGQFLESLPLMYGGAGLTRFAAGGMGRALTAAEAHAAAAAAEGALTAGSVFSDIQEKNPEDRLAKYLGLPAGAATALLSKFGGNIEARIASPAARTGSPSRIRSGVEQGIKEGFFEELPQSVSEAIFTNLGTGRPWDEGLAKAAASGLAVGSLSGGAFGAALPGQEGAPVEASNPLFQGGQKGVSPEEIARLQEADTVGRIVDENIAAPAPEGPMGPPDPYLTDLVNAALGNRNLPAKSREWLELALLEVDTLPEGADRMQALRDLSMQLETRLENYRGNLGPTNWLMLTKDAVDTALAREESNRPAASTEPQPAREVSSINEAFEQAFRRDPNATSKVVEDMSLDEDGLMNALLDIATAPEAQAPVPSAPAAAANPLVQNPQIQRERPDEVTTFNREQQTVAARRSVLERLMQQDVDGDTLAISFMQALQDEGYSNPTPTPQEVNTIRRYDAVRTALDNALIEERSPEVDNSPMEALIPEKNPLAAAPVALDKESYTAALTPLQIGFVKNVLLESARRGVPVSQARNEMVAMLSRIDDPRAQEASSVDFSRIARLGKMAREVAKALPRKRTPPSATDFQLTPPVPGEARARRPNQPGGRRATQTGNEQQGDLFQRQQAAEGRSETEAGGSDSAQQGGEGQAQERTLSKGQARAFVVAALRNSGIYEGELGMRSMRADVEALMNLLEEDAIDGVYTEQEVRDAISSMADYFGGATLEMAGATASILTQAHVHSDVPLVPVQRLPLNVLPAVQPEHRRLIQTLFDIAVGMMPPDSARLVSQVGYTMNPMLNAAFNLGTGRLTFNPDWLDSILKHGGADNLRSAAATILHEMQHAVDRDSPTSVISAKLPEFDFEYIKLPDGTVAVNGTGTIMREAVFAYDTLQDEGSLDYPLSTVIVMGPDGRPALVQPSRMKAEVFAQLGRLYFSNRALLGRISPAALQFFGEIYGNASSIEESIARLRGKVPAERAGDPLAGQIASISQAPTRNAPGILADGDAGSGVATGGNVGSGGQTGSPEFQRWFAGSKVVDEQGRPLVVYHGTVSDFSQFEDRSPVSGRQLGNGFYFGDAASASQYSQMRSGSQVMPVYLSIRNPFLWDGGYRFTAEQLKAMAKVAGFDQALQAARDEFAGTGYDAAPQPDRLAVLMQERGFGDYGKNVRAMLEAAGFDGVAYREGGEYVAFRPEQIKSAIGNNGQFDPNNPSILADAAPVSYGEARPGAAPPVQAIHYSRELRNTLSSSAFGTGLKGAERERIDRADPVLGQRINFYVNAGKGITPEAGVGAVAHQVILNNVYDIMADPLDIAARNGGDPNQLERAIVAAGFDGYMAPGGNQNVVVLLGRRTVPVQPFTGDRNATTVARTAPKERTGIDAFSGDSRLPAGSLTGQAWRGVIERMYPDVYTQYSSAEVWGSQERFYRDELAKALRNSEVTLAEQFMPVQPLRQDAQGRYRGAPQTGTKQEYRALKARMMKLLKDPLAQWSVAKDWYYKSHDAVLEMFPNDPKRQDMAFRLLAIYSQANSLGGNVTAVLKSFGDIIEGRPIARGRFPTKTEKYVAGMLAAPTLDRSVEGVDNKIMSFYRNLKNARDPAFAQESTIDRWMLRLLGYTDMSDARAASPDEYAYTRHLIADMANDLSAPGQPIVAHQVQAALWTYVKNQNELIKWDNARREKQAELREMKARVASLTRKMRDSGQLVQAESDRVTLGSPNEDEQRLKFYDRRVKMLESALKGKYSKFEPQYLDYSDYFVRNVATSTMEMVPHPDTGVLVNLSKLPPDIVHAYTIGLQSVLLDELGNDKVVAAVFDSVSQGSDKNRIVNLQKQEGFGSFEGTISPNDTTTLLLAKADDANLAKMTPKLMNAYVSMVGYIFNQKAALWHKLNPKGKVEGAVLRFPSTPSFEQLADLYDLLRAQMPGVEFSKVGQEIRLLNFTGSTMQEFMDRINKVVADYTGTDFLDAREARFDTGYIENDWRKFKDGEVYLEQIQLLGNPELIQLARRLRAQADNLNRDFARNFPEAGSPEFSPTRQPSGPEREAVLFAAGSTGSVTGFSGDEMRFYAKLANPATGEYDVYVASTGSVSDPTNASNVTVYRGRKQTEVYQMMKALGLTRTVRTKPPAPTAANPLLTSQMVDLTTITDKKAAESGKDIAIWGRELKRLVVDSKEVIERLEQRLQELDPSLADNFRLWMQDETLASATAERIRQEQEKFVAPLVEALKDLQSKGITLEEVDTYIWSLVTPYRNAIIFERTDQTVRDGAGQTNAQALQNIRDLEARGNVKELQRAADLYFKMMNRQLQINGEFGVESSSDFKWQSDAYSKRDLNAEQAAGLLTPSDYQESVKRGWGNPRATPWYSPMKTFKDSQFEIPRATTSGGSRKFALGRSTRPDSVLSFGLMQFNAAIPRGFDNRFKQNVYATAVRFQDVNFWVVDEIPTLEYLDQSTGLIKRTVDKSYKQDPGVMVLRIDGNDHTVRFLAPEVAAALIRQPEKARTVVGGAIVNTVGTAMRLLSGTHTAFNPDFWLVNLTRDAASVLLNAPPEVQKAFKAEYLKQLANPATWDDSSRYAWSDTPWGKGRYTNASPEWKEFAENGGPVRFDAYLGGFEQTQQNLQEQVNPTFFQSAKNRAGDAMNTFTGISETMDNGVRFAAYKAARTAGVSPQAAAAMAKNATANFERRGSLPYLNLAYMFFNAAVQGTRNTARAIGRSRVTQGAVIGLFVMGFVAGALGYASGGEDEDDYRYAKVPNFTRDKKLVINPDGVAIPLPQGFNWFYALGNSMADMVYSKRSDKIQRGLLRITNAFTDAFLPNDPPNADSFPQYLKDLVTPELLKPVAQLAENKNAFGRNIIPDAQAKNNAMPDVKKGEASASEWSKQVTKALYNWNIDMSPATLDFLAKYYTGSVGQLWQNVYKSDGTLGPKTPVAGKFMSPGPVDYELQSNLEDARRELARMEGFAAKLLDEDIKRELAGTAQFRGIVKGTPEYERLLKERDARRRVLLRRYDDFKRGE